MAYTKANQPVGRPGSKKYRINEMQYSIVITLVSYCSCNKLPKTWWLKTTQIYYLTVLDNRNPKRASLG